MRNISLVLLVTFLFAISTTIHGQGVQQIWGSTGLGGKDGAGTIFSMNNDGTGFKKRYDFSSVTPGSSLWHTDMESYNGKFYGITNDGGSYSYGVLFSWDPVTNQYTNLYSFNSTTGTPYGVVTILNNKLYGIARYGGSAKKGSLYEFDLSLSILSKITDFSDAIGFNPIGGVIKLQDKIYGLTKSGGSHFAGTLYEYDPATGNLTNIVDLNSSPGDGNVLVSDGIKIYGGIQHSSEIFEFVPQTNSFTIKYTIPVNAFDPWQGLTGGLIYTNNKLYGTVREYQTATNQTESYVFEFDPVLNIYAKKIDLLDNVPCYEQGGFRLKVLNQKLYGVTYPNGVVFEFDPANNNYSTIASFTQAQGNPLSLAELNGKLYGCATYQDGFEQDYFFEVSVTNGTVTKQIQLLIGENGTIPIVAVDRKGKLFGACLFGGGSNRGTMFEFDRATNTFTKKHDAISPTRTAVVLNDKFITITYWGGANNIGEISEFNSITSTYLKKYDFTLSDGAYPNSLTVYNNKVYGTTSSGGANNSGVIFEWDNENNSYTKKYDFSNASGKEPLGLSLFLNNKFYGITKTGGLNNNGVIFEWDPSINQYTKKIDFPTGPVYPGSSFVEYNGKFFGVESSGNSGNGYGYIFEWDPSLNLLTTKYTFTSLDHGTPSSLIKIGSRIFGTTSNLVGREYTSIFQYLPESNQLNTVHVFDGINGTPGDLSIVPLLSLSAVVASIPANTCTTFSSITIDNSNNNQWVPVTNEFGDVVAEIKANGNNLGTVSTQLYVNSGPVREDAAKKLYLDRSLTITPQTQPSSAVDIRLYITEAEYTALKNATNSQGQPSGITSITDLGMFKNSDACSSTIVGATTFVNNANVVYDGGGYVITGSVTSFSSFYFANKAGAALPLTLLDFTGELQQNNILLKWKTTKEYNTDQFIIQRSTDGMHFEKIGTVPAKNKDGVQQYQYTDVAAASSGKQIIYYRLLQKDNDSRQTYSNITAIALSNKADVIQWPNPVSNQVNLLLTVTKKEKIIVRILDLNGRSLKHDEFVAEKGSSTKSFNTEGLKKGTYIIEVRSETLHKNFKVVK